MNREVHQSKGELTLIQSTIADLSAGRARTRASKLYMRDKGEADAEPEVRVGTAGEEDKGKAEEGN